ncbi:MAG: NAD(P)/FAD-dependent oxidoreductase [Balneola sp.]
MQKELQLRVTPEVAAQQDELKAYVNKTTDINASEITYIEILKRSIDARQRQVKINLKVRVYVAEEFEEEKVIPPKFESVHNKEAVIIVGAGPAGLFAALKCIELGMKPVVLDRGKDVKSRIKDLKNINVNHIVNPDSNYCFGEGGAGTYSDGKLYTRSKKRGDVNQILELLVAFGAKKDILVDAHPHIGTNKLPSIIAKIREFILEHGGDIHFNSRVTDLLIENDQIKGVRLSSEEVFNAKFVILATGHSARDIFELLYVKGIEIEAKPIAIGVRVEHSQSLIDSIQYNCEERGEYLPPAPYKIVKQINERGVYSFCMCPGGVVAACATKPGEVVTNGWSGSQRSRPTANSGIVVELGMDDFKEFEEYGPLKVMEFQKAIEQKAWEVAGKTQKVPAQRLMDFTKGIVSKDLPNTSYTPGLTSANLQEVFPDFMYEALKNGFLEFGKTMKGYLTNEAVVHAPESRTSSPVRIPRDHKTLEHIRIKGLFPCGEGAGYAGGIVSAAIDGRKVVEAIKNYSMKN